MNLLEFNPENELERTILDAKSGACSIDELLHQITESNLFVSSRTEVEQNGSGFSPLLLGESTSPLVAVFTLLSRADLHRQMAEYVLEIKGREFFKRLPSNYGVVFNPGYITQLVIASDSIPKV